LIVTGGRQTLSFLAKGINLGGEFRSAFALVPV